MNTETHFLIVGSGRLARHLEFYFLQKSLPFSVWHRGLDEPFAVRRATHILLAISDSAIAPFIGTYLKHAKDTTIVHFSGALNFDGAVAAHPLMTFGPELYARADYEKIHFVLTGADTLAQALPGLQNSFSVLPAELKPLYHALCVLGGNFPILLWQKMAEGFRELGLPPTAHAIYVEKMAANFNRHGALALTGPLVRKDHATMASNLKSLEQDPFHKIYSSFVEAYK